MDRRIGGAAITLGAVLLGGLGLRRLRPYSFAGKVAVVTGGSRGLGLVLARELASRGARVAICARDSAELARARVGLADRGYDVLSYPCDVRDKDAVEDFIQLVTAELGPVDVLVNNAGVIQAGPLEEMTLSDFEEAIDTFFWGPLYLTLAVLPQMRQRRSGRIVNVSSIGGKLAAPHYLPYCAGKFALTGLSEGLRAELMREGIVVTTVCPGLMRTGSPVNAFFKGRNRAEYAWFILGDSLPPVAISAERAARKIVEACRRGRAEVTLSAAGKLSVRLAGLFPGLVQDALGLFARVLPRPGGIGQARVTGKESEWWLTRSPLTALTRRAAVRNNELSSSAPSWAEPSAARPT